MSAALLARIDRGEASTWRLRIEELTSAGLGVMPDTDVAAFGEALAFATPTRPMSMFNRVMCMAEPTHVDEVLAWYAQRAALPRFELCPLNASDALRSALTERGFVHTPAASYCRRLFADPMLIPEHLGEETVEVRPVTAEDFETWMAIDLAGFSGGDERVRRAASRANFAAPRIRRFLAFIDGKAVALGRVEMFDGVAYLNGASTLNAYRRRGCQRSLAIRRVRVVRALGCDLITGLAAPDSDSERNMRRAGLTEHSDREPWLPQGFCEP